MLHDLSDQSWFLFKDKRQSVDFIRNVHCFEHNDVTVIIVETTKHCFISNFKKRNVAMIKIGLPTNFNSFDAL